MTRETFAKLVRQAAAKMVGMYGLDLSWSRVRSKPNGADLYYKGWVFVPQWRIDRESEPGAYHLPAECDGPRVQRQR
jgi:hypothetical protein